MTTARVPVFLVVQAEDFGVGLVELAEQVPAVVRDQQFQLDAGPRNGLR